ncbi:MAG: glutamine synthetase, partial [Pseudomonadota bacterium]
DSKPEAKRVENRFPGMDANPYLALAATLACGYLGIKEKVEPTAPTTTSAYDQDIEVARSLLEALELLRDCKPLAEVVGERFVRAYCAVKEVEYEEFNKVISSWEREYLLLNV